MLFSLTSDQLAIRNMASEFAAEKLAPKAIEWDQNKHFPINVMREAAALGMAGIYVRGMSAVRGSPVSTQC
jgi:alkylation response protein AidB-like acyl-CoA dehydrogenase